MIDTITDALNEYLENLSQWFLDFFFSDQSANTGGSAFKYLFEKISANIFSFNTVLFVVGVLFLVAVVRFMVDLIRG